MQAHYACVCADTWASEVGILSPTPPRLVTTWRTVPPGTNGGVSALGCGCSAVAGVFMGASHWLMGTVLADVRLQPPLTGSSSSGGGGCLLWCGIGLAAGVGGSLIDSLLGATVQFSGVAVKSGKVVSRHGPGVERVSGLALIGNDAVNAVAAGVTAAIAAACALHRTVG
jgi:uncharacterized membrane protein